MNKIRTGEGEKGLLWLDLAHLLYIVNRCAMDVLGVNDASSYVCVPPSPCHPARLADFSAAPDKTIGV